MGRTILLVNHWGIPFALLSNLATEFAEQLPSKVTCYLRNDSAADHFHNAQHIFADAHSHGWRTVCLGVTEWTEVGEGFLTECSERYKTSHSTDHASPWNTYPWRSLRHDLQVIEEAREILEGDNAADLLLCLNLLACRDTVHRTTPSNEVGRDDRAVPPSVRDPQLYASAIAHSRADLTAILPSLATVIQIAQSRGASIGMSVFASLSLGEHGLFGSSYMKEGTSSVFLASKTCRGSAAYADDAVAAFVTSCLHDEQTTTIAGSYPFSSVVSGVQRTVERVNDKIYAFVRGHIFDLVEDPDELIDVQTNVVHLAMQSRKDPPAPPPAHPQTTQAIPPQPHFLPSPRSLLAHPMFHPTATPPPPEPTATPPPVPTAIPPPAPTATPPPAPTDAKPRTLRKKEQQLFQKHR